MGETEFGKYFIAYLIKGDAKEYHLRLSKKIAETFGIFNVSDVIGPHITLKYFNILLNEQQVKELEKLLKNFCENHHKAKLKLQGIGQFENKVLFMKVKPSEEMKLLYRNLVKELEKLSWITWNEFDKENIHFHATLAEKNIEPKFEEIYKFASKKKPNFDLEFDNICILKKPKDKWILHKKFKLN